MGVPFLHIAPCTYMKNKEEYCLEWSLIKCRDSDCQFLIQIMFLKKEKILIPDLLRFYFQGKPDFRDPIKVLLEFNFSDPESGPILDSELPNSVAEYVSHYNVGKFNFCFTL